MDYLTKGILCLPFILLPLSSNANECPITKATLIDTNGETKATGFLKQTFIIPPAYEAMKGRLKFLSDEWPEWYGSEYNDSYSARIVAPGEARTLASGNLNSSIWSSSHSEYNGEGPTTYYTADFSGLAEQQATLTYKVNDVGDAAVDSALSIEAVHVLRTEQFVEAGEGFINESGIITGLWGAAIKLSFTNVNAMGALLKVENLSGGMGSHQGSIVLPGQTVTFSFTDWGPEPHSWGIKVSTDSDAMLVTYDVESTWAEGMPLNPCNI